MKKNEISCGTLGGMNVSYTEDGDGFEWQDYPSEMIKYSETEFDSMYMGDDDSVRQILDHIQEYGIDNRDSSDTSVLNALQLLSSYDSVDVADKWHKLIYFDENEFKERFSFMYFQNPQQIQHLSDAGEIEEITVQKKVVFDYHGKADNHARHTYTDAFDSDLDNLKDYLQKFLEVKINSINIEP